MYKVFISPQFNAPDKGEGGIRRVVEAQKRWLPKFGFGITKDIAEADIAAYHAAEWVNPPNQKTIVVSHCHGLYWADYEWPKWADSVNRDVAKSLRLADHVTAPSQWVAYAMQRGMWLNPDVLYHGIEPSEWPASVDGKNSGYVLWNKTRTDVICDPEPLNKLAALRPDVPFVTTFGKERDNVKTTGVLNYTDAKALVYRAGVYLANTRETMGIGTLEAMAAGVPVLGFNWGGQPEIVVHKQHGYLAEPYDYDDLAVGLDYCLEHRAYLSQQARAHVLENFTWQQMIGHYAALYNNLLDRYNGPKVSIIITNYNLGRYLPEAVASAKHAAQSVVGGTEILIVDDASTEPLPSVITDDPELLVLKNKKNLHIAGALNVGIEASRGRYILLLDADNRVRHLNELVKALDADRSLDIAYGKMSVFTDDPQQRSWVSDWPTAEASLSLQMQHKNQITSTALYRRKVYDRVGGYRRRCTLGEDADFWTRALAVGATARRVTELVTLEYRSRSDSVSQTLKDWNWHHWYYWSVGRYKSLMTGGPIFTYQYPKVSVVIPVGPGHEEHVLDALDSVQAQSLSFMSWEALVINDTGKPLKRIHHWARVYPGGEKGVSHARNRGLLLAKGEYVLFLDADDYLHPDALYHLYNTAVTASCDNKRGVFVYSDWYAAEDKQHRETAAFRPLDVMKRQPYPVTCLYKKHDLTKNGVRWDESFKTGWEDWDFTIQAVIMAEMCGIRVPLPLMHYRLKSGTLRNEAYSHQAEIKLKVNHKWQAEFDRYNAEHGGDIMGGCGGCGGGKYPSIMANMHNNVSTGIFDGVDIERDTTLIEYNPPPEWTGMRAFIGRGTGNRYRFGPDPQNRVRRVYKIDVPSLLAIGYFTEASGATGVVNPLETHEPQDQGSEVAGVGVAVGSST